MTRAGEPLLQVQGLQVHFPIKRGVFVDRTVGHVRAVDGVDLAIDRGTTYGLVGESGCGKSTLGRAVLRLVEPTAGRVLFDGTDVASLGGEPLRHMRRRMQMVFQDPLGSLDPRQDVESLLSEPLRAHGLGGGRRGSPRGSGSCSTPSGCRPRRCAATRTSSPAASGSASASPARSRWSRTC
jgi:ATPase components of various ABC-type transport systems, contain duplicated ATPase